MNEDSNFLGFETPPAEEEISTHESLSTRNEGEFGAEVEKCERTVFANEPGVLRAFGAIDVYTDTRRCVTMALVDRRTQFVTSLRMRRAYNGAEIVRVLEDDFDRHGPPLALVWDEDPVHQVRALQDMLDAWQVLSFDRATPAQVTQFTDRSLQHCSDTIGRLYVTGPNETRAHLRQVARGVNENVSSRALERCTPRQAFEARPGIHVERGLLLDSVRHDSRRLLATASQHGQSLSLSRARRMATTSVLEHFGYLGTRPQGRA